jgi:protein SCO1/2
MKRASKAAFSALAVAAVLAGLIAGYLLEGSETPTRPQTHAALFDRPRALPAFHMTDNAGQAFTRRTLQGQWSLLYFGYTHCPDVCPTTLNMLNEAVRRIASDGGVSLPQVYFISVDPRRDTRELLSHYVPYFNPNFIGVRGAGDQLKKLADRLGVAYSYGEGYEKGAADYTVKHSPAIFLINPAAQLEAVYTAPYKLDGFVSDYEAIVHYYEANQ